MNERPRLTSLDLWARHERRCIGLLRQALTRMPAESVDEMEVDLNRRLYRCIIRASHSASLAGEETLPVVVPEGRNPPAASDEKRAAREHKIPDLYWAYIDHLSPDADAAAKQFVVECKRLSAPTRNWTFTSEYVASGIVRFVSVDHGYGQDAPSGAMVGYLQNITIDDALNEISITASAEHLPAPAIETRGGELTAELHHRFDRPFRESPFELRHLWIRVQPLTAAR
jgi:hypothetical protein